MRISLLLLLSISIFCAGMEKSESELFSLYNGPGIPVIKELSVDKLRYINTFKASLSCTCCNTHLLDIPIEKIKNKEIMCSHACPYKMHIFNKKQPLTREEIRIFFSFKRMLTLHKPEKTAFNITSTLSPHKPDKKENKEDELLLLPLLERPTEEKKEEAQQIASGSWTEKLLPQFMLWSLKGK